jgi:phenylpropionate dioxygenase-like ring-hydroxylating dioxygenase large terminal subunit
MCMLASDRSCTDVAILDQWHPLTDLERTVAGVEHESTLLGESVGFTISATGEPSAWTSTRSLPARCQYGYLWTSLGSAASDLFDLPEFNESDRRNIHVASFGIHCSAPRLVENFLDMSHLPFVHEGWLGEQPHTEVADYNVRIDPETNDLWATECMFWQPVAAASASGGQMVEYNFRVAHPYCAMLYKSCPLDDQRRDVIGLFVQPLGEEWVTGHMLMSYVDHESTTAEMRRFSQTIFGQDKPILENQVPKRLPLDSRAETPIRADKMGVAYRRWLSDLGVTYGVIPASPQSTQGPG